MCHAIARFHVFLRDIGRVDHERGWTLGDCDIFLIGHGEHLFVFQILLFQGLTCCHMVKKNIRQVRLPWIRQEFIQQVLVDSCKGRVGRGENTA